MNEMTHHIAIAACTVFSFLRVFSATSVVINIALGASILLQGTWFVQAAYFLFAGSYHKWRKDSPHFTMITVACFTWHVMLIALGNIMAWIAMSACARSCVLQAKRPFKRCPCFMASLNLNEKEGYEKKKLIGGKVDKEEEEVSMNGIKVA